GWAATEYNRKLNSESAGNPGYTIRPPGPASGSGVSVARWPYAATFAGNSPSCGSTAITAPTTTRNAAPAARLAFQFPSRGASRWPSHTARTKNTTEQTTISRYNPPRCPIVSGFPIPGRFAGNLTNRTRQLRARNPAQRSLAPQASRGAPPPPGPGTPLSRPRAAPPAPPPAGASPPPGLPGPAPGG